MEVPQDRQLSSKGTLALASTSCSVVRSKSPAVPGPRRLLSVVLKGASRATAHRLPLLQPRAAAGILSSICFSPTSLPSTPSTPQACNEGVMGMELVSTPAGEAPAPGLFHPDSLGSGGE